MTSSDNPGLLIVDDEPHICSALCRLFRQDGYRIHSANSPAEAEAILETNAIDVIISDQRMPDGLGSDFLDRVQQRYPDTVRISRPTPTATQPLARWPAPKASITSCQFSLDTAR